MRHPGSRADRGTEKGSGERLGSLVGRKRCRATPGKRNGPETVGRSVLATDPVGTGDGAERPEPVEEGTGYGDADEPGRESQCGQAPESPTGAKDQPGNGTVRKVEEETGYGGGREPGRETQCGWAPGSPTGEKDLPENRKVWKLEGEAGKVPARRPGPRASPDGPGERPCLEGPLVEWLPGGGSHCS